MNSNPVVLFFGRVWGWVCGDGKHSPRIMLAVANVFASVLIYFYIVARFGIYLTLGLIMLGLFVVGPLVGVSWVIDIDFLGLFDPVSTGLWVVLLGLAYMGSISMLFDTERLVFERPQNRKTMYDTVVTTSAITAIPWILFGLASELGFVSFWAIEGAVFVFLWLLTVFIDAFYNGRDGYFIDIISFLFLLIVFVGSWGVLSILPFVTITASAWTMFIIGLCVLLMYRVRRAVYQELGSYRVPYDPALVLVFVRVPLFIMFVGMVMSGFNITNTLFVGISETGVTIPLWMFLLISLNGVVLYLYSAWVGEWEVFKATLKEMKEYHPSFTLYPDSNNEDDGESDEGMPIEEFFDEDGEIDEERVKERFSGLKFDTTSDEQKELLRDVLFAVQELYWELERFDGDEDKKRDPEAIMNWNRGDLKGFSREIENVLENNTLPPQLEQAYRRLQNVVDQSIELWYDVDENTDENTNESGNSNEE